MIDYCTSNRIFSFILALIGFSVLIFFVEEYAESAETNEMKFKKYQSKEEVEKHAAHSSNDCWLKESFTFVQSCEPCSDFEINAIKAKHCLPTGFYDKLNCSKSGVLALRPCMSRSRGDKNQFWWFFTINFILMVISTAVAVKRKEFLGRNAYMRVQQQFE